MERPRVMIAGIGGASLGTEIGKSLKLAGRYEVFGCDISATAFGLYAPEFTRTFYVDYSRYIDSVIDACLAANATWLVPGGEQPMVLLGAAVEQLSDGGIRLVGNNPEVIRLCSDKRATFERMQQLGIAIPKTVTATNADAVRSVGFPCIVKPATASGGSASVFLATDIEEALVYIHFIRSNAGTPLAQEYIDIEEGEYTVGVLSLPDRSIVGSIALRRSLDAKLSVAYRGRGGVISSGYSQGLIADFPRVRRTAEEIARDLGSEGPLNIQGRVRNGEFIPFEINPRFSASTYLRAMARFNEIDMFLRFLVAGEIPTPGPVQFGWYLRSLSEIFVPQDSLR